MTVLVVAAALIAVGAVAALPLAVRSRSVASAGSPGRRALELLWTALPIAFLVLLVALAARRGA